MIKFTTPEGIIYICKDSVIAIAETRMTGRNNTLVKTLLFIKGLEIPFNLLEDVETVHESLGL